MTPGTRSCAGVLDTRRSRNCADEQQLGLHNKRLHIVRILHLLAPRIIIVLVCHRSEQDGALQDADVDGAFGLATGR